MTRSGSAGLLLFAVVAGGACAAPPYEAKGSYTPAEAAGILRERPAKATLVKEDGTRRDLGEGARIVQESDGFRAIPAKGGGGSRVVKLQDGDAVVMDEAGHLVAIRSRSGAQTTFAPGTASLPPNSDEVLVQEARDGEGTKLAASDRVEVIASYFPGDRVPGQGKVEEDRRLFALVTGGILMASSYGPSVFIAATSPRKTDRVLLVPVAGPFIDLVARPKCTAPDGSAALPVDPCAGETGVKVGLVASGLAQAVAVVLIGLGLPAEAVLVKDAGSTVRVGPLGAHGTF